MGIDAKRANKPSKHITSERSRETHALNRGNSTLNFYMVPIIPEAFMEGAPKHSSLVFLI